MKPLKLFWSTLQLSCAALVLSGCVAGLSTPAPLKISGTGETYVGQILFSCSERWTRKESRETI
jgi:hypothetical protein